VLGTGLGSGSVGLGCRSGSESGSYKKKNLPVHVDPSPKHRKIIMFRSSCLFVFPLTYLSALFMFSKFSAGFMYVHYVPRPLSISQTFLSFPPLLQPPPPPPPILFCVYTVPEVTCTGVRHLYKEVKADNKQQEPMSKAPQKLTFCHPRPPPSLT
jgi:hypothetical protein